MTNNFSGLLAAAAAVSAVNHPHLPRIWLLLTLTPAWLKSVVYLDESIREASDWDGPGQAGVAQVGVTPLLQLSFTSGQNLQESQSQPHPQPTAKQQLACVKSHVPSCSVVSLSSHSASFLPGRTNSDVRGGTVKLLLSKAPVVSCISHWSAHKWSAAIDPLVFLINGLSLWETTGFSSPIRTLWWIYNSTAGLWLHQCLFSLFSPPKLYKCGHKKTVPVLDNNFLRFLLFHSAENKDACISYEIFAQRFKVLTVIAIDLHFDDSLGLPCGVGFDEYVSIRCGTSALYAVDG